MLCFSIAAPAFAFFSSYKFCLRAEYADSDTKLEKKPLKICRRKYKSQIPKRERNKLVGISLWIHLFITFIHVRKYVHLYSNGSTAWTILSESQKLTALHICWHSEAHMLSKWVDCICDAIFFKRKNSRKTILDFHGMHSKKYMPRDLHTSFLRWNSAHIRFLHTICWGNPTHFAQRPQITLPWTGSAINVFNCLFTLCFSGISTKIVRPAAGQTANI